MALGFLGYAYHEKGKALRVPKYVERTEQLARELLGNTHLLGMVRTLSTFTSTLKRSRR